MQELSSLILLLYIMKTSPSLSPAANRTTSSEIVNITSLKHLITPAVIKKAKVTRCFGLLKNAQVLDSQYTVKLGPGVTDYEYRVLQFLDTLPSIPTPKPLAYFDIDVSVDRLREGGFVEDTGLTEVWHVIVMSTMPGKTMDSAASKLSPAKRRAILGSVKECMDDINRAIIAGTRYPDRHGSWSILQPNFDSLSDLDGVEGRCLEIPLMSRFREGRVNTQDFVQVMSETCPQPDNTKALLYNALDHLTPAPTASRHIDGSNDIRFCHMDLHQENIMVEKGKLSGIIDWEMAGWYTWALEICAGLRHQYSAVDIAEYTDAWQISDELKQISYEAQNRLKLGAQRFFMEECRRMAIAKKEAIARNNERFLKKAKQDLKQAKKSARAAAKASANGITPE